jgi:hypothetical protein
MITVWLDMQIPAPVAYPVIVKPHAEPTVVVTPAV